MLKGIRLNKWIIVMLIAVAVVLLLGACKTMFGYYVSIRGQRLQTYRVGSGGGMTGGYYRKTVKRDGAHALISIESAEWHSQDPTVTEYLTDAAVLDELEAVVRKYKMNFWNRKRFTNMFINDGESESYYFGFDEADISFSSQLYPMRYRKKLEALDGVVKKYIESGEHLPGLVNPRTEEESFSLPENELVIYVYSYAENALGLRILNGTDKDVEIPAAYSLMSADTGVVLLEEETPYGGSFSERSRDELELKLKERLPAGSYRIVFGELELPFEIR